jgi:ABC-2 type transport system permease protein
MRKATVKILGAFGVGILLLYGLLLLCIGVIGKLPGASGFTLSASMFFALSLCSGAVMFLALGALTSQLMPTRSKAAGLAAVVFGVFYVIRLAADTSSYHWLLDLSPLGWVEKLQPMYNSDPVWLIPIGLFTLVVIILSVYLSGKRDVYSAVLADSQSSKPHKALLGSAFLSAIRINRAVIIGWLAAISVTTVLYSMLAKGAVQSLSKSSGLGKGLKRLSANHAQSILSTKSFMGIVFLIVILTAMFYIANAVGRIREDEGLGYLDNFLVRPFSRTRWLAGRLALATASIVLLGLLTAGSSWIGQASQHSGLAFSSLLAAGMNAMVPVVFVLASAVFIFGFLPRLTRSAAYIVLGWSFLITLLSSGLNINHWILDSSIFHQISLAPAVNPNWHVNLFILLISVALLVVGGLGFNNRDLAGE